MLLAERLRKEEEKAFILKVIEKHCDKVKIDVNRLYDCTKTPEFLQLNQQLTASTEKSFTIVWTPSMKRLFTLVGECLKHKEPGRVSTTISKYAVLLVGETGTGKTTICQLYSILFQQKLHILNCHQHTETSDFLGGLRPVRGKNKLQTDLVTGILEFLSQVKAATAPKNMEFVKSTRSVHEMMEAFK